MSGIEKLAATMLGPDAQEYGLGRDDGAFGLCNTPSDPFVCLFKYECISHYYCSYFVCQRIYIDLMC